MLRHNVYIKHLSSSAQNAIGEKSGSWVSVFTKTVDDTTTDLPLRAAIMPLRGNQFFQAQELNSELEVKIRIRYHSGISPDMRVYWHDDVSGIDRIYKISYVQDPDMRHVYLDLICKIVKQGES